MSDPQSMLDARASEVSDLARALGRTVAVAESLTGGLVAASLAKAKAASDWFRGAVVGYSSEVKHELLGVPPGPVVSADAAAAMAREVRRLLGADVAVGVTGAGGPDPQDGRPPGTVFLAVDDGADVRVVQRDLPGDPADVCAGAACASLDLLVDGLGRLRPSSEA